MSQTVETYYDKETPGYIAGFGEIFQADRPTSTEDLLSYLLEATDIKDGMRVLDAGCGVGGPSVYFAKNREAEFEAVTISSVQVEEARKRIENEGLQSKLNVRQGDYHNLSEMYPANSFDRVLFLESLCHAEDYRRVLTGAKEILKPWGMLYIKDFYATDNRARMHLAQQQMDDLKTSTDVYKLAFPYLPDLMEMLGELGFVLLYARRPRYELDLEHYFEFENVSGLIWSHDRHSKDIWSVFQGIEILCVMPKGV